METTASTVKSGGKPVKPIKNGRVSAANVHEVKNRNAKTDQSAHRMPPIVVWAMRLFQGGDARPADFLGAEEKINQFPGAEPGVRGNGNVDGQAPFGIAGIAKMNIRDQLELRADAADM